MKHNVEEKKNTHKKKTKKQKTKKKNTVFSEITYPSTRFYNSDLITIWET